MQTQQSYDVVICGGGLAGQTLARQLKLTQPQLSILILEQGCFPRPVATLKVGESTIEASAFYLSEVLQLREHLDTSHLRKLGFRYIWSDSANCLSECPEIGLSQYGSYPSYQIDRGILENYLHDTNCDLGVDMVENVQVQEINLSQSNSSHDVHYQLTKSRLRQNIAQTPQTVKARWVIDAMGRRKFLQRKLNLLLKSKPIHSAVWFRVKGRVDIEDLVPDTDQAWHQRVPGRRRYYSTTHLMGDGYWVWLIPLSSGHTSIGIVTREPMHHLPDYITLDRAMKWLQIHQPALYQYLQSFDIVDFLKVYNYSYASKQIFSTQRWACIGDAALFPDPFYSPGMVLLGYENSMVTKMIALDREGELTKNQVQGFNNFALGINQSDTYFIQTPYTYFKHPHIWSVRYLAALTFSWGIIYPQMFNSIFLDAEKSRQVSQFSQQAGVWAFKLEAFFKEWVEKTQNRISFQFIDYLSIPFLQELYTHSTQPWTNFEQVIVNYHYAMEKLEEFIQVTFLLALRDVMPEKLVDLPNPLWLNIKGISLDSSRWERNKLFQPTSTPRNLNQMRQQIEPLYRWQRNHRLNSLWKG